MKIIKDFFRSSNIKLIFKAVVILVPTILLLRLFEQQLICFLLTIFLSSLIVWSLLVGFIVQMIPHSWSSRQSFFISRVVAILFLVILKTLWVKLEYIDNSSAEMRKRDFISRALSITERAMTSKVAIGEMPAFPKSVFNTEWAIVNLSMISAVHANLAILYPETARSSIVVIDSLIKRILEKDVREFEIQYWNEDALESLDGPNGNVGYLGHLNFMLGAYRKTSNDSKYDDLHHSVTASLRRRLENSNFHYIETIPGQIFVPDNMPAYASLRIYDSIFKTDSTRLISRWREYTRSHLIDPNTGLIVPMISMDGKPLGPGRGTFAAWNIFYLAYFDKQLALEQYELLKQHFLVHLPFKAIGIREYVHGHYGEGDANSGPVFLGISSGATGLAIAGAVLANDTDTLNGLLKTAEIIGSTIESNGRRRYLLAPLLGDSMILAMRTLTNWGDLQSH